MAYATDADLLSLIPSIFDHGESSFTTELAQAELDVKRDIEIEWTRRGFSYGSGNTRFDAELLTASQWKRATLYKALADHIMPALSPFRPEDAFQLQMTYYKTRYSEEITAEFARGIQYDLNDDGVDVDDIQHVYLDRLYR
jgi:hypothetical protein